MTASSLIFVTGASGFIGSQVVIDALNAGHRVRVNVRREAQIEELRNRFAPAPATGNSSSSNIPTQTQNRLEFVVTADLSNSHAIRGCLDKVDYIFHLASPMPGGGSDFQTEYLGPAVQSTEAILEAAASVPSVKRVVITSSLLALIPLGSLDVPGLVVKEGANPSIPINPDMSFPAGPAGHGPKYAASKILAHRATLDWVKSRSPHFDLITLHPTFVVGHDHTVPPVPVPVTPGAGAGAGSDLGGSGKVNTWVLDSLASGRPIIPGQFVDVRDVSRAHLGSLDAHLPGAAKETTSSGVVTEVLLPGPTMNWEAVVKVVKRWEARNPGVITNKMSDAEGTYPTPFIVEEDSRARALEEFGIGEWTRLEDTIGALLDQVRDVREGAGKDRMGNLKSSTIRAGL